MQRVAGMLVLCGAAPFVMVADAGESPRPHRSSQLLVGASLVPSCTASVSVEGRVTGSQIERLAQVSCPSTVPYRITVSGDPGPAAIGESTTTVAAPGTLYLVSVEF